jgi:hypothetical protein
MRWTVLVLPAAREELLALPPGLGARMVRLLELISEHGLDQMREPHVKLWTASYGNCEPRRRKALRAGFIWR